MRHRPLNQVDRSGCRLTGGYQAGRCHQVRVSATRIDEVHQHEWDVECVPVERVGGRCTRRADRFRIGRAVGDITQQLQPPRRQHHLRDRMKQATDLSFVASNRTEGNVKNVSSRYPLRSRNIR